MNIDTDTQWAYWDGLRVFEKENHDYLQGQIGNPKGADKPNKKFYDPRVWLRAAEESMIDRIGVAMEKLGSKEQYARSSEPGHQQCISKGNAMANLANKVKGIFKK
jgi:fructose-bisphosphate aldolase class II